MALSNDTKHRLRVALANPTAGDEVSTAIDAAAEIGTSEIANLAVTTAKIASSAVTDAKVATGIDAAKLADGSISNTEFQYLNGVTSAIQTQLNAKAPTASPTFSGTVTTPLTASRALVTGASSELAASSVTATELGYVSGVTSAIQTQLTSTSKVRRVSVGYAALNSAGTGVAALIGTAIPDNAIVKRVYLEVLTTFAGNGDDGSTIKIGLEDQDNDVVAAIAISNGANPWDAGLHEGIQDGTMAAALKLSAARQLAVTWTAAGTDTALTAGSMDVFVEYVEGT